jgi:hypothetical protein
VTSIAICIAIVAVSKGIVLPTDAITLGWTHTVEGTRWEEDYTIVRGALVIREARVKGSGAGMDPPTGSNWAGGWWRYFPSLGPLREVTLANSSFAPGYTVCWNGACRQLQTIVPLDTPAKIEPRPCRTRSR